MTRNKIADRARNKDACPYRGRYSNLPGVLTVLSIVVFTLSGCASIPYKSIPTTFERTIIKVSQEGPSKMTDLTGGEYRIPKTQVYVYRIPSPQSQLVGVMFGLVGVLAASLGEKEESKAAVNEIEEALRIDMTKETREAFDEMLREKKAPTNWALDSGEGAPSRFEVRPYIILTVEGDQIARPFLFLKMRLLSETRGETWANRYIYYIPERRAVVGPNSWTEKQGGPFKIAIRDALRKTLDILFKDMQTEGGRRAVSGKLKGRFMAGRKPGEREGEILEETDDKIIFNIPSRDIIDGGINIIPKTEVERVVP